MTKSLQNHEVSMRMSSRSRLHTDSEVCQKGESSCRVVLVDVHLVDRYTHAHVTVCVTDYFDLRAVLRCAEVFPDLHCSGSSLSVRGCPLAQADHTPAGKSDY